MGAPHHDIAFKVTAEQRSLLNSRSFTLRPLSSAGHLTFWKVVENTWQPIVIFVLPLLLLTSSLRYGQDALCELLCQAVLLALLISPTVQLSILVVGVVATKLTSKVRWPAVLFWMWWPLTKFVACVAAAVCGFMLGNYLWFNNYLPHVQLERMQVYANATPKASGIRLQDAGVATFDSTAGVDRLMTGCLKNGPTFCVAPIVPVEQQGFNRASTALDHYDLFMAGTDCCSCPGEFRCGDWSVPATAIGGLRVVDAERRQFYSLAAQDFAAGHAKVVKNPIFFEWKNDASGTYRALQNEANVIYFAALTCGPLIFVLYTVILNGILQVLCEFKFAAPLEPPVPQGTLSSMSQRFLPQMHQHMVDQQAQLSADQKYGL